MKRVLIGILAFFIMVLGLVGCSGQNYKEALELYEKGNYEEAQVIFVELGDYENSSEMVKDCIYNRALVFLGKNNVKHEADGGPYEMYDDMAFVIDTDLQEALTLLESISEYKDAAQLIEEITIEQNYREAIKLFKNGEFDLAEPLFEDVGSDYRNEAYKYIAAIPLLKEYADTTWKNDGGYYEDDCKITVKISAPYSIESSKTFSDCDWSVYANIEIDAVIIGARGGISKYHFNYEELIPHPVANEKNQLSGIYALYKNDDYGSTFTNLLGAPYSIIILEGTNGGLKLYEIPYSSDWNTSYPYSGTTYNLEKQN